MLRKLGVHVVVALVLFAAFMFLMAQERGNIAMAALLLALAVFYFGESRRESVPITTSDEEEVK